MIHLLYGESGTGKTHCITEQIAADIAAGRTVYLIVPEQEAVSAEAAMTAALPPSAQLEFEVLNFTRLANRVFRRYGGLSYKYLTRGMKSCVMWRALRELGGLISYRADTGDTGFIALMLSAIDEFRRYSISPDALVEAADALADNVRLSAKLRDLATVYGTYEALLTHDMTDPTDDIGRLGEVLSEHNFFAGSLVYIDSFTDFTTAEMNVIERIAAQANSLTITLACDGGGHGEWGHDTAPHYKKLYKTAASLRALGARNSIDYDETLLTENHRAANDELRSLALNLWRQEGAPQYDGTPEHIHVFACRDIFTEAERVAADICRRVAEEGFRYRDIAVIARDSTRYEGIIDAVFDEYEIPYFMSQSTDIKSKPLSKLIFCALSIHSRDWRREDVLTYVKTGLAGISPEMSDELSLYSETWNISRSGFSGEIEWTMNPDGFREEITPRAAEMLSRMNIVREKINTPLNAFFEVFRTRPTVRTVCTALYEFLVSLGVPEQLSERINEERAAGAVAAAQEDAQLWNVTLDALDRLAVTLGEVSVSCEEFSSLLAMLLDETSIGTIPTSVDSVTVGSACALRAHGVRAVYIIGACRGVFPQSVSESSIMSDAEKIALEGEGIVLSPTSDMRAAEELFYFYRAATLPREELTISYYTGTLSGETSAPSSALLRIFRLFPQLSAAGDPQDVLPLLYCRAIMRQYAAPLRGSALGAAIRAALPGDEFVLLADSGQSLVLDDIKTSPAVAEELFAGNLHLSQQKLEDFVMCHFSFYCKHILKIKEARRAEFNYADIGNFMHRILERILTCTDNKNDSQALDYIVTEYVRSVCPPALLRTNRVTEMFSRLRRTAGLLTENLRAEFAQSEFSPTFFEYKIGMEGAPALAFPLPDGSSVQLSGIADRIDTYVEGGRAYVRVVDYKTGNKKFSLADVAGGINLQLLIYLFSLWKTPSADFLASVKAQEVLPAGLLYFSARPPEISVASSETQNIREAAQKSIARSGLLLENDIVLRAMERELEGKYLPVALKKGGGYTGAASLTSLERFGALYGEVGATITELGCEIKSGAASARPKTPSGAEKIRCTYCPMHPVCRRKRR